MPTLMPADTAQALGPNAHRCDSRSLFLDRFADPTAKDIGDRHPRRDWFNALLNKPAVSGATTAKCHWLTHLAFSRKAALLYAQLQSRLMLNMAGGVMENAGLCLDRFGLPYIPGSAVKGCARRAALAALREWCENNPKPGAADADPDNPLRNACAPFATRADMLVAIAQVFGWCEQDWGPNADFVWAANGKNEILIAAINKLASAFGWTIEKEHLQMPWKSLPNFAGSVSFLPAYPVDLGKTGKIEGLPFELPSELGKLEIDVVTCHHRDYYDGKLPIATDTEDPVPVVFPAVAPGHVFVFALAPLRGADHTDHADHKLVQHARAWLATGLSVFGLGAKTNAGYGWFEEVTETVRAMEQEEARRREEIDRQAKEKATIEAARQQLQPDSALIEQLRAMKEPDLRGLINPFATEERFWIQKDEVRQLTLTHFLLVIAPEFLTADRANPKSKIAKAIANLTAKFPQVQSQQP